MDRLMLFASSVVGATPSLQKECNWIASAEWDAITHYYRDLPLSCMIAQYRFSQQHVASMVSCYGLVYMVMLMFYVHRDGFQRTFPTNASFYQ